MLSSFFYLLFGMGMQLRYIEWNVAETQAAVT